ncbi:Uncharacterized protein involved in exopolysaccharide biosynthesis [Mesorhizobium albiziae]|uniref:Uncharacterized protein involved in exopolysaccharide biosynthesis n=2 Tax=Neomesorhizobium albiziae TaxID=335020 RepID=A0A1I4B5P3_9HYPH|nr:Uncharacterized protein involved in exopolysaccharide biosynthesis [Mesorhizobium albiziae]
MRRSEERGVSPPAAVLPEPEAPRPSPGYEQPRTADDPDLYWRPLIDPMRVVMGVVNSKGIILATTVIGALLGVAIAVSTPKQYESVAELLIDPRDLKIVDRDLTQSGLPSDATMAIVENQVRVLTSGTVLNKVVDKLNFTADPEFNGEGAGAISSPIAILRSLLSRDSGSAGDNRRALAVSNLAESLTVERGGKTFVVVISARSRNPEKSALIANTLTDVFLQTYGEIQSDTAGRAADELTSRLAQLRADVEAAERKVEAYKTENDLVDAQGRLISDDEMVKLNEQLSIARARTLELNAKSASTRELDVNAVVAGTLPEEITSNVMTELRSQYASLRQEGDRLAVKLGPRHPQRLAAEAQLAGAREQIQAELRRIISANQVELKRAVQLEQQLASRLAQVKVRQGGVSEDMVALRELEREAAAKRAVYESFLLRARETGEQRDLNTANMSVISKAYPPLQAVGPSRSMISIAGMMLGLLAGIGIGAARGALESLRDDANPSGPRRPRPAGGSDDPGGSGHRSPSRGASDPSPRRPERSSQTRRDGWTAQFEAETRQAEARLQAADAPYANHNAPVYQPQPIAPVYQQPVHAPTQQVYVPQPVYPQAQHPVHQPWLPVPAPSPYGYAPAMLQPAPMLMQPAPYAAYVSSQPYPAGMPQPMPFAQQHAAPAPDSTRGARAETKAPIEEVRDSLREFRATVLDMAQNRARRRHS